MSEAESSVYKLVVLGGMGVGKTALVVRFMTGNFSEAYDPTVEDSWCKDMVVNSEECVLDILDTAGNEEFQSMQECYRREHSIFLGVYSITSLESYETLQNHLERVVRLKDDEYELPNTVIVIAANKGDLEHMRQVETDQMTHLQLDMKAAGVQTAVFETSAKTDTCVETLFATAVELAQTIRKSEPIAEELESESQLKCSSECCVLL